MYIYIIYVISIIYIWYTSGERVWSPQCFCWLECAQCVYSWTRTLLKGLWNVHNFCDTCTTSVKRAQVLGNVHSTTSLKRAHIEYLKRLGGGGETRYIYRYIIYICVIIYVYVLCVVCVMCYVLCVALWRTYAYIRLKQAWFERNGESGSGLDQIMAIKHWGN